MSGSFKAVWAVYREEGRTYWGLDTFSTDAVGPFCYVFLRLAPCGHGAVKITRKYIVPEN